MTLHFFIKGQQFVDNMKESNRFLTIRYYRTIWVFFNLTVSFCNYPPISPDQPTQGQNIEKSSMNEDIEIIST